MNTADYALIVSLFSVAVSIGALVWNVIQKFIFVKPKLQVSFGIFDVLQHSVAPDSRQKLLSITVTNMGPGVVTLHSCIVRLKPHWWRRRGGYGLLNPIHGDPTAANPRSLGPFSAGLPAKIGEGDAMSFYFPYTKDAFVKEKVSQVGVYDTYHRNSWCHRKDVKKVMTSYRRDFLEKK